VLISFETKKKTLTKYLQDLQEDFYLFFFGGGGGVVKKLNKTIKLHFFIMQKNMQMNIFWQLS
jgi:hypothetical protein